MRAARSPLWCHDHTSIVPTEHWMRKSTMYQIARAVGAWVPALLLVLIFSRQGWAKFDETSGWAKAFRHWGYPGWFRMTIGIMELSAVGLLLLGRTAAFGAILIIIVMLGAMTTHVLFDGGRNVTSEVVPLSLAIIVLVVRRGQLASVVAWARGQAESGHD